MLAELGPEHWNALAELSFKVRKITINLHHMKYFFYARNIQETFFKCLLMLDNISNFQRFARLWYDTIGMPATEEYYIYK